MNDVEGNVTFNAQPQQNEGFLSKARPKESKAVKDEEYFDARHSTTNS
jgi:hypothetical protein